MKKSSKALWLIIFCIFFLAPQILYLFLGKYVDDANSEKRELAEMPQLSLTTVRQYPIQFDTYYNDTLPFRNQIIQLNSLIDYYGFHESPVSKVICGENNWLFYNPKGDDGDPIGDLTGGTFCTEEELEKMVQNLVQTRDYLATQGREFVIMINPNKESIYGGQYLPEIYGADYNYTKADQVVSYLKAHSDIKVVYPKEDIQKAMKEFPEYEFYFSTDTHWNELGAYVGTKSLLKELGCEMPVLDSEKIKHEKSEKGGDLANMMGLASHIMEDFSYDIEHTVSATVENISNPAFDEHRFVSDSENKRKLLIIRDSFGNAMAPYIGGYFSETYMPHRIDYSPSMIQEENPDIVVYEVVERYVDNLLTFSAVQ